MGIKYWRWLILLSLSLPLFAQTTIFNCSSFTTSAGSCSVATSGAHFWTANPSISGGVLDLVPTGSTHNGYTMWYQTAVNVQAFTSTFTFVPSGYDNLAFVVQNDTNQNKLQLSAGAGPEGGFSQYNGTPVNNVFAMQLDQWSGLTQATSFSYSSVQIYQSYQEPALPDNFLGVGLSVYPTNKVSTTPVALNSPANSQSTTTGDTYSATVSYDGWNFNVCLFDITAANGSCSSATSGTGTFFQNSWSGVLIPEIVGSTTAILGLTNGVSVTSTNPLLIDSFSYTVETPTGTPSYTAWNANSTYNNGTVSSASPVYSVAPGTYSSTQSVAITTSSTPHNYVCYVLTPGTTPPTLYPQPDNNGGCVTGTLYSSAVSIAATSTLYAMAGSNNSAFASGSASPTGIGPPSTLVAGLFTIGASQAVAPSCSPTSGSSSSPITVTCTNSNSGTTIMCYTEDGTTPTTNGAGSSCTNGTSLAGSSNNITISSSVTSLKIVAGTSTLSDSTVSSYGAYTITGSVPVASGKVLMTGSAVIN